LPFELLYDGNFLITSKLQLIRQVSDWGQKRKLEPENRPLKLLFMACSPIDAKPALDFEKEEDTIFEVTKDLPIEVDIEDTGSLQGLGERLATTQYDIVHLTGHVDIDENGNPFFWMENDEGHKFQVFPAQLCEKLKLNLPKLIFLSGCRTGQVSEHVAAVSFAQQLVAGHVSTALGWGLPVTDVGARLAAQILFYDLSRGKNILDSVFRARQELLANRSNDWSILRIFSDGSPLHVPMVKEGQIKRPKLRELQYRYLQSSQVKVLEKGFIGRRRQIQRGLRCLRKDDKKVGLLLYGTGGLGKSCLTGKFCDRLKDHILILVHGELNSVTLYEALKDGFIRANDKEGLKILEEREELPDKIRRLCSSVFQARNYLIILDDFEKNMPKASEGVFEVSAQAVPNLETLIKFLPYSGKMTQLIITSRYTFTFTFDGIDIVRERLEPISLTSFRDADEQKKVLELHNIANCSNSEIRQQMIQLGHGNPRLMEALDALVGETKGFDFSGLLAKAKNKEVEFIQELVLRQLLEIQSEEFKNFLRRSAVYRLPIIRKGIERVSGDINDLESLIEKAVQLSLMEKDTTHKDSVRYWVTPLLREEIFDELKKEEQRRCHQAATSYYQFILTESSTYLPIYSMELILHALNAGLDEIAIEESGGRFLPFLRQTLAYKESLWWGEYILSQIHEKKKDKNYSKFLFELGFVNHEMGNDRQAIDYFEQALTIDKEIYGDKHPNIATTLNNIGSAWDALGEHKKAIGYFEQALTIDKEIYGDKHPNIATTLNNIGSAWDALGEHKKAIEYFEQALTIDKEIFGEKHPSVARDINNIGGAWLGLKDFKRAKEYFQKAYEILREFYSDDHPHTKNVKTWLDALKKA